MSEGAGTAFEFKTSKTKRPPTRPRTHSYPRPGSSKQARLRVISSVPGLATIYALGSKQARLRALTLGGTFAYTATMFKTSKTKR